MIKKALSSLALLLALIATISEANQLTNEQLAELPVSVQKFVLLNRSIIDKGGKGIKAASFKETNYQLSGTAIYGTPSGEPQIYMAIVNSAGNEASIGFKVARKCNITKQGGSPIDRVIRVDGTNISAATICGTEPGSAETLEVFVLKTRAGKAYIQKKFSENLYVFVDFGNGEIPFATDGFNVLWQRANEPAL